MRTKRVVKGTRPRSGTRTKKRERPLAYNRSGETGFKKQVDFKGMPATVRGLFNQLCELASTKAEISVTKSILDAALEEVNAYARRAGKSVPSKSEAWQEIGKIAMCVSLARELRKGIPTKTEWRHQAQECSQVLSALSARLRHCWWTLSSATPYFDGPPERLFDFAVECSKAANAFQALANSGEFRRKGRPSNEFDERVLLLLMCRGLLTRYSGRAPGWNRGAARPSPLVRLANAIYGMTGDERPPSWNRVLLSLKRRGPEMLQVHGTNPNPILEAINILMMKS